MRSGAILTGPERRALHGARVMRVESRQAVARRGLATLGAMAELARQTGATVHVVVERQPGVVEHARDVAVSSGVQVSIDLRPYSIRVRFDGARA
jgi:hypothetical protein